MDCPIVFLHGKPETSEDIQEECDPFKNSQIVFFVYIIQGRSHRLSKGEGEVRSTPVGIMMPMHGLS